MILKYGQDQYLLCTVISKRDIIISILHLKGNQSAHLVCAEVTSNDRDLGVFSSRSWPSGTAAYKAERVLLETDPPVFPVQFLALCQVLQIFEVPSVICVIIYSPLYFKKYMGQIKGNFWYTKKAKDT